MLSPSRSDFKGQNVYKTQVRIPEDMYSFIKKVSDVNNQSVNKTLLSMIEYAKKGLLSSGDMLL